MTTPNTIGTGILDGPCWDYDKVFAAHLPVFITSTGATSSSPLYFAQGVPFNVATVAWGPPKYIKFIDDFALLTGPNACTKSFFVWDWDCYDTKVLPTPPPAPKDPSGGHAAFFEFEAYKPKSTEYGGSTTTKTLLKVTQVIGYNDSATNDGSGEAMPARIAKRR